jgi:hypothetical protein
VEQSKKPTRKSREPEEKWMIITITNRPEGKVTFRGYEFDARGKYTLIDGKSLMRTS